MGAVVILKSPGSDPFIAFKSRAHAFSGLCPDAYYTFINEIDIHVLSPSVELAQTHLYKALEALQDMALYAHPSSDVPQKIQALVDDIGDFAEDRLMKRALERAENFTPKYLKEYQMVF